MESIRPFSKLTFITEDEKSFIYRCPFCGDSKKHFTKGHLYVSKIIPVFHCFRCGLKGHISKLEEEVEEQSLYKYTLHTIYKMKYLDVRKIVKIAYDVFESLSSWITDQELSYLRDRLKIDKIDHGLLGTVPHAYVSTIFRDKYNMNDVRVWTSSVCGTIVNGRVIEDIRPRYYNLKHHTSWSNVTSSDAYFIKTQELLKLSPEVNTLVIAEGVYDIIPIYLNRLKYGLNGRHIVYSCTYGKFYYRAIQTYKLMYNRYPKHIRVFADIDVTYKDLINMLRGYGQSSDIVCYHAFEDKDWTNSPIVGNTYVIK